MRRLRVVIGALAVLLLVIGGRYFLLPRADSVAAADYLLDGPTRFTFPYETGTPAADCRAAPLLGFFSTTLHCTLSYPSRDVYHCKVFTTTATVGAGARCDTQPVRPYQCKVFTTTATVGAGAFCDT
jgi:hypothetical protein